MKRRESLTEAYHKLKLFNANQIIRNVHWQAKISDALVYTIYKNLAKI